MHSWNRHVILVVCSSPLACYCTLTIAQQYAGGEIGDGSKTASVCSKVLPDVGMVQMYSKSANVNDLGFEWTSCPPSLHGLALLLVPTVFPSVVPCPSEIHCTIPTSALVFGRNIFTHLILYAHACNCMLFY